MLLRSSVKAGDAKNQKLSGQLEMSVLNAAQTQATNEKTMARLRERISGLQSGMSQREAKIGELETAIAEQSKAMRAEGLAGHQSTGADLVFKVLASGTSSVKFHKNAFGCRQRRTSHHPAGQYAALQSEVDSLSDEKSALSEHWVSKEHIHKLIRLIADQDGTIDYQEGELEELQDIVQQYEANASAPWLSRLKGLLVELLPG